jgi:ribose 5-phosphate isomerase B
MRIAIGSDHRGVQWRQRTSEFLASLGNDTVEFGGNGDEAVDYPDIAAQVAHLVANQQCDRGILFCGTGIGVAIAANKVNGIRAAVCHDRYSAEMSRRHNDANVLCLSAERIPHEEVLEIVKHWLTTDFEAGRHQRRVDKIAGIEAEQARNNCHRVE